MDHIYRVNNPLWTHCIDDDQLEYYSKLCFLFSIPQKSKSYRPRNNMSKLWQNYSIQLRNTNSLQHLSVSHFYKVQLYVDRKCNHRTVFRMQNQPQTAQTIGLYWNVFSLKNSNNISWLWAIMAYAFKAQFCWLNVDPLHTSAAMSN